MELSILAIDPGSERSAWVVYRDGMPTEFGLDDNNQVLEVIRYLPARQIAIEMIASYGMAVGATVFDTCVWIGRFAQHWYHHASEELHPVQYVYRKDVKMHLCGQARAKDANIRQALIDRYGGKDKAIGLRASPGPCYKMKADIWQALAVAVTASDLADSVPADYSRHLTTGE